MLTLFIQVNMEVETIHFLLTIQLYIINIIIYNKKTQDAYLS